MNKEKNFKNALNVSSLEEEKIHFSLIKILKIRSDTMAGLTFTKKGNNIDNRRKIKRQLDGKF